jgi:hypothetical protein
VLKFPCSIPLDVAGVLAYSERDYAAEESLLQAAQKDPEARRKYCF